MAARTDASAEARVPLSRGRVLAAAVTIADEAGIEALSMRRLGQHLGVEAMSLYNHVANKEDLLDGVIDAVVSEIDVAGESSDWKSAIRRRAMSAREVVLRHPWAPAVLMSRTIMTPTLMKYHDSLIGILRDGGFSIEMAHRAMHTLGSRLLGFTQELFETEDLGPEMAALAMNQIPASEYPNISDMLAAIDHDKESLVGRGCDDQAEFEFGLELILDGLERLRSEKIV